MTIYLPRGLSQTIDGITSRSQNIRYQFWKFHNLVYNEAILMMMQKDRSFSDEKKKFPM